jgi:hypothetical protein
LVFLRRNTVRNPNQQQNGKKMCSRIVTHRYNLAPFASDLLLLRTTCRVSCSLLLPPASCFLNLRNLRNLWIWGVLVDFSLLAIFDLRFTIYEARWKPSVSTTTILI